MKRTIQIKVNDIELKAILNNSRTAQVIWEASIIREGLCQINLEIMRANSFRLDHDEEAWRAFMDKINNGGWDYLEKMASTYEQDVVNSLVSINVCPSCESRLIEEYIDGKTIAGCNKCGKAWEILKK